MSLVIDEAYLPATLTEPPIDDDAFVQFCAQFPDYFVEVSADGDLLIMPPGDVLTSAQIGRMFQQLLLWADGPGGGWVTESSGGFVLPNGARRAPDVAWFPGNKPGLLDRKKRPSFPRFAPDFVIELRSPGDRLCRLRSKMAEWIENGTKLAWLVDPERRAVEIYRPSLEPETILEAENVHGEGPAEGFVLQLGPVWDPISRRD